MIEPWSSSGKVVYRDEEWDVRTSAWNNNEMGHVVDITLLQFLLKQIEQLLSHSSMNLPTLGGKSKRNKDKLPYERQRI
jgi:hypothetical protein